MLIYPDENKKLILILRRFISQVEAGLNV